jgi:hypothetical protein
LPNEITDQTIAAKETTMARSSACQQQQRATLDALVRMAAADGFSPEAARPMPTQTTKIDMLQKKPCPPWLLQLPPLQIPPIPIHQQSPPPLLPPY